jgi:hypothetical protein
MGIGARRRSANQYSAANPPARTSAGAGVDTFYAVSSDSGATFAISMVPTASNNPSLVQFGNRDVPFHGDCNSIAANGSPAFLAWTDNWDSALGTDPRYPVDGADDFDVKQCRALLPDGTCGADTCPNDGGLDENVCGAVVS